jgi:uncharacterized protein YuzE
MKLKSDSFADAAHFQIAETEVASTREIEPGVIADYDAEGHLVGIEVLHLSRRGTAANWVP